LEQAIDALPPSSCFINFIEFWDPKIQTPSSFVLGAILTLKEHDPIFVRIGEMASIYRSIRALRTAMNNGDTSGFDEQTSWLSEKLWSPIAAKIPQQVNRLIISPDGELNFLSFAALLDAQGKFLAETHDISYMGSARDLVRETKSMPSRTLRLFANPAFQRAPSEVKGTQLTMRSAEIDLFGQLQLPPLPGTEKESAEIQKIATDDGWQLQTFSQEQADEQALRKTKNPGILHLATHGFYLNSFAPAPLDSRGMSVISLEKAKLNTNGVDPMRASGIALAGAQSTLKSWSERKAPSPEADGVLTAEEVAALDLDGTWLVTLSACETGVGEARSGEGVLGLRRSFMMAGAENLLMTLWPVSDQTTSEIMADFYREALKTRNAPGSLAKVQREWLVKLRKEKGLLEAVRDAGPFVMATIGKPLPPLPREPAKEPSILDKVTQKIESLIKSSNTDIKNN
jgi:CHAT domain-containing protein